LIGINLSRHVHAAAASSVARAEHHCQLTPIKAFRDHPEYFRGIEPNSLDRPHHGTRNVYGKFYQITRDSRIDTLGPLWHPWHPGWGGWAYWDSEPEEAFVTHYTGHVLANLAGPDGKRMRCEIQLLRASEGMKGGGEGRCQLPSGKTIKADFPPS
jgi:hypothetical protein